MFYQVLRAIHGKLQGFSVGRINDSFFAFEGFGEWNLIFGKSVQGLTFVIATASIRWGTVLSSRCLRWGWLRTYIILGCLRWPLIMSAFNFFFNWLFLSFLNDDDVFSERFFLFSAHNTHRCWRNPLGRQLAWRFVVCFRSIWLPSWRFWHSNQLCERWSKGSPAILNRQLNWDPALNRHLIEITRAGVSWVNLCLFRLTFINHYIVVSFAWFFAGHDLLFNFFLELFVVDKAHLTRKTSSCWVVIITVPSIGALRAFYQIVSWLSTKIWLWCQDWAFVLERRFVFESSSSLSINVLVMTKACHHGVQVELVWLGASEGRGMLAMEQDFGLVTCLLFGVSIY